MNEPAPTIDVWVKDGRIRLYAHDPETNELVQTDLTTRQAEALAARLRSALDEAR